MNTTVSTTYTSGAMENRYNTIYQGEIYLGTPPQQFFVVWDTGSGALLLKTDECDNCAGDTEFIIGDSSTFEYKDPAEYDRVTYMDGTSLYG